MRFIESRVAFVIGCLSFVLCSCSTTNQSSSDNLTQQYSSPSTPADYSKRIPQHISTGEKTVVVDPRAHAWGAYGSDGELIRAGVASAGSDWCNDLGHPCRTHVGTYHVFSLGNPDCKSHIFPIPRGGAPMPYCMYFNNGQALHGVPDSEVGDGNYSHGCVRMHVSDAEWLRYNFVGVGTKVVVRPYD
jgi:hypothetical protein